MPIDTHYARTIDPSADRLGASVKLRHLPLLVASVVVLSGCGVVTDPDDVTPAVYVEQAEVEPSAVALFGQESVDQAVAEITSFAVTEAFPPALLDPEQRDFTREELIGEGIVDRLTVEAAEGWEALVDAALEGDSDARDGVRALRFYDVDEQWTLPVDEPVVVSQQITELYVDVDDTAGPGQELLSISFDHDATLAFREEDRPVDLGIEKSVTFWLTPAAAEERFSWSIASFEGEYEEIPEP